MWFVSLVQFLDLKNHLFSFFLQFVVVFRTLADETIGHTKFHPKGDATFVKLFQICKTDAKRSFAIEETVQNMFGFSSLISKS